jgi:hypothetical protein
LQKTASEYGPNEVDPHDVLFQELVSFHKKDAAAQVTFAVRRIPLHSAASLSVVAHTRHPSVGYLSPQKKKQEKKHTQ